MRAGIGLIKLNSHAGILFWMGMIIHQLASFLGFIRAVGWSGNENIYTINILFIFFSNIIFLWPKVSERFPHQMTIKCKPNSPFIGWQLKKYSLVKLAKLQLVILMIVFGFAYYQWKTYDFYRYPRLEQVNLRPRSEPPIQEELIYQDIPLQFSMGIPQGTRLLFLNMNQKTWNSFSLFQSGPKKNFRYFGNFSDLRIWKIYYQSLGKLQGFKNEYEFARKVYSERFASIYLLLLKRYLLGTPVQFWESQVNGLNIFVSNIIGNNKGKDYRISVFFEGKNVGDIELQNINQKVLDSILSTLLAPRLHQKISAEPTGLAARHNKNLILY